MLTLNFKRIFLLRGIANPNTYLRNLGFSQNVATRMANNQITELSVKRINQLCKLLNVTPADFFDWTPDSAEEDRPDNPMQIYRRRKAEAVNLQEELKKYPLELVQNILEGLKEK